MKILTSDKTGNRPVVTSCNRLIDYVENSEYTLNCWSSYAIDIAVILVLSVYWHKKFEHRVGKSATVKNNIGIMKFRSEIIFF